MRKFEAIEVPIGLWLVLARHTSRSAVLDPPDASVTVCGGIRLAPCQPGAS